MRAGLALLAAVVLFGGGTVARSQPQARVSGTLSGEEMAAGVLSRFGWGERALVREVVFAPADGRGVFWGTGVCGEAYPAAGRVVVRKDDACLANLPHLLAHEVCHLIGYAVAGGDVSETFAERCAYDHGY